MRKSARNIACPCKFDRMIRAGMNREICVKETGKGKKVRIKKM